MPILPVVNINCRFAAQTLYCKTKVAPKVLSL